MTSSSMPYGYCSGPTPQTSKFFDLPAEVCHEIYCLAFDVPRTHVTLHAYSTGTRAQTKQDGSRQRIQFEYFVDSPSGLEVHPVRMSGLRICRQIYNEIMNLWFERSTWAFGNASMLLDALDVIPISVQSQIRSLALWVEPGRVICTADEQRERPKNYITCSIQELNTAALRLRSFRRLQVLQLYIDLATFRKRRNPDLSRRNIHLIEDGWPYYDFSANEAIGEFVWCGMETRISIAEVDLERLNVGGLWNDLGHCFGPSNVQWVPHGKDRYRGVVGDIVIKDEMRKLPGSSGTLQLNCPTPLGKSGIPSHVRITH